MPTSSKFHSNRTKRVPCIVKSLLHLSSQGQLFQAISSLGLLSRNGIRLPSKTLAYLLQQCANTKSLKLGKWVHLHLKVTGLKRPNTFLANHLINMYSKCGDYASAYKVFDEMSTRNLYSWNGMLSGYAKLGKIKPARKLFDKMPEKDVVSWNTMVIAYAKSGFCNDALRFYRELRRLGIGYNEYSFAGLLNICVKVKELELSKQAHGQVLVAGFLSNLVISSSVLDAYAKCSEMGDARRLFDEMIIRDVLAWTTMVSGYAQWGDVEAASELFDLMPEKNPVAWTSLIAGYARHDLGHKALELFTKMMALNIRPDQFTFSSCLCASASIASLNHGKQIHGYLIRTNIRPNTIVVSSLIDMYSKCGCLEVGRLVFDLMGDKWDVVLWNTIISSLAQHGRGQEATQMFDDMVRLGMKPDRITLIVLLNACSHSGLVQEGLRLYESITSCHGVIPNQEHYACLIDLLGRAGHFDTLMNQLEKMPCKPNDQIWNALLGVCRMHGNIEFGREVAEKIIELDPQSSAAYVLLSSIHAAVGRWELVENVRQLMNERHVRKDRAISWIEIENKVHSFTASDRLHPLKEVIYLALKQLAGHMEEVLSTNRER
ncbi:pentatricopeptide repeat-containing protein At2g21090 [Ricinus communis]|uniref:pentatricopeptide repeat-containing protein At2g21090 n=1 Tax=Ricinus communis TaxID=3988 RepID=UPI00201A36CE|nr:pentatricopeptide repeat-containing protein At2g21090 [Ricinus communis]